MWVLIAGFACNFVMQTVSYSFYKRADKMTDITSVPQYIQMTDKLTGYGYNLEASSDKVILFFGGSNYIAYNSVGKYAYNFECPFLAVDYYGTQDSKGNMNLIVVTLNDGNDFQNHKELYEYGFNNYSMQKVFDKDKMNLPNKNIYALDDYFYPITKSEKDLINVDYQIKEKTKE